MGREARRGGSLIVELLWLRLLSSRTGTGGGVSLLSEVKSEGLREAGGGGGTRPPPPLVILRPLSSSGGRSGEREGDPGGSKKRRLATGGVEVVKGRVTEGASFAVVSQWKGSSRHS